MSRIPPGLLPWVAQDLPSILDFLEANIRFLWIVLILICGAEEGALRLASLTQRRNVGTMMNPHIIGSSGRLMDQQNLREAEAGGHACCIHSKHGIRSPTWMPGESALSIGFPYCRIIGILDHSQGLIQAPHLGQNSISRWFAALMPQHEYTAGRLVHHWLLSSCRRR